MIRLTLWFVTCFHCKNRKHLICKCRNVKSKGSFENSYKKEIIPVSPPFPSDQVIYEFLSTNRLQFNHPMTVIEEELTCLESCAVCFYGYQNYEN